MKDKPQSMELQVQPQGQQALMRPPEMDVSVGQLLKGVIDKGITGENVNALEKLIGLYERMEDKKSEREFAAAFNALQAEMPRIKAMSSVPDKTGGVKFTFAAYEDIMEQVRPYLLKHGFTVAFDTIFETGVVTITCKLQHVSGHTKETKFGAHVGQGPPGASPAQADGAAATYAKRFALCNALNIVVEKDTDARLKDPAAITPEQAKKLEERVTALISRGVMNATDKETFLLYAGAKNFGEIAISKWAEMDRILRKKEAPPK